MTDYDPETDPHMNPGIVRTVKLLLELGYDTLDSGDGETHDCACDLPVPYVHMEVPREEMVMWADALKDLVESRAGLDIWKRERQISGVPEGQMYTPAIEVTYSPVDGHTILSLYGICDRDLFAPHPALN